jgi:hypothetical protein
MAGSKIVQPPRPASFARYIAASAFRRRALADAYPDRDRPPIELDRRLERGRDPSRHHDRLLGPREPVKQDAKLVAAEPRDAVGGADRVREPVRDRDKEAVAGRVPQAVVDRLEAVEIEEQDARLPTRTGGRQQRAVDAIGEEEAVGESGKRVVEGVVGELLLEPLSLAHVGQDADRVDRPVVAAHDRRGVLEPDRPSVPGDHPELLVKGGAGHKVPRLPRECLGAVIRVDERWPEVVVGLQGLARVAEHGLDMPAHEATPVARACARVIDVHVEEGRDRFEERPVACLCVVDVGCPRISLRRGSSIEGFGQPPGAVRRQIGVGWIGKGMKGQPGLRRELGHTDKLAAHGSCKHPQFG